MQNREAESKNQGLVSINEWLTGQVENGDFWYTDKLSVRLELGDNLPTVHTKDQLEWGDEYSRYHLGMFAGLRLVINHLLQNIHDHVRRFPLEVPQVIIRTRMEGEFICLDDEDDGPGIKNLSKVQEFLTKRYSRKSNLGLAHRGVIFLGGTIDASNLVSEGGEINGARFTVRLPTDSAKMNEDHATELLLAKRKELRI